MTSFLRSGLRCGLIRKLFLSCPLFAAFIPAALAQTGITCTAFVANQPTLRQEGATEPAGDILIACSGTLIGAQTSMQTLSLYVNGAAITSRQLYTGATPDSIPTEAALLVNDCTTNSGTSSSGQSCSPSLTFSGGNPTQGFLQNGALVFSGFTLPASGSPFEIRITNVRVNANQVAAGSFITGTVLATFGVQNQQNLVLGAAQNSLSASISTPISSFFQCQPQTTTITNLTIKELVNTAFKSPASSASNSTPGGWYQNPVNNESQTVLQTEPASWINQVGAVPGQADQATRIRVNVANIPAGVTVTLPDSVTNGAGTIVATSNGDIGAFSAITGGGIPINFSGSVTYEVRAQSPSAIDSFNIPITISGSGNVGVGLISLSATYAPTTAETSTAIPRFQDTSALVLAPLFNVYTCAPAAQLAYTTEPSDGTAGSALPPVVIQVQDASGNIIPGSTAQVTLTSAPSGVSTSANAVNGVATFNGLTFGTSGTYTLSATSPGLTSTTSRSLTVISSAGVVVFSNLNGTSTPGGYIIGQYGQYPPLTSYVIGTSFTPSGQSYTLTRIQANLSFSSGVNDMDIGLYSDSGGVPGSLLESWELKAVLTSVPSIITVNSVIHPTLLAGHQYWITTGMGQSTSIGDWWVNNTGVQQTGTNSLNGGSFIGPYPLGLAFAVNGNTLQVGTTTTALQCSPNPSTLGQLVTCTATVSPSTATGTVTFMDGSTTIGIGTLSGGTATLMLSTLAIGTHSLTAVYGGDGNDSGSTSSTLNQSVNLDSTTTSLVSSLNPSTVGQNVTLTAVVSPSTATGTVTFKDGSNTLNTQPLSSGTAALSTTTLSLGSHSLTAVYNGDANDSGSTSSAITQTVAAIQCSYSLNPSSASVAATASTGSVGVTAPSGCTWTASSNANSVTITGGSSGSGNGAVTYSVAANTNSTAQTASLTIAGLTFTITQAASVTPCSYTLPQSSQSFSSSGGTGSFSVVAPGGCNWTATTGLPWVTSITQSTGSGNGTVNYTVSSNTTGAARNGAVTITGTITGQNNSTQPFSVTEAAAPTPTCVAAPPSSTPQVDLEGRTEIIGGVTLTCSGLPAATTAEIILTLNTSITNKVNATTRVSDAALQVNGGAMQGASALGNAAAHWPGVALPPGNSTITISNVRADASLLAAGSSLTTLPINGQFTLNATPAVTLTNANQNLTLANAVMTLQFQEGSPDPATGGPQTLLPLIYQEATVSAFHAASGNTPATAFRMVLSNVPSYVTVYAPLYPAGGSGQGQLYMADCSGQVSAAVTTGITLAGGTYTPLTVTGGVATATWEVVSANPTAIDTLTFPLVLLNAAASDLQAIQVDGSYAPVSPPGTTACGSSDPASGGVPRYRDSSVPQPLLDVQLTTWVGTIVNVTGTTPTVRLEHKDTFTNLSTVTLVNATVDGGGSSGDNQGTCTATGGVGGTCMPPAPVTGQYFCQWTSIPAGQSVQCTGDAPASGAPQTMFAAGTASGSSGSSGSQVARALREDGGQVEPELQAGSGNGTGASTGLVSHTSSPPGLQILSPSQSASEPGSFAVSGYAVDPAFTMQNVQIYVDGNVMPGNATYGLPDPNPLVDCGETYAGAAGCPNIGFSYALNGMSSGTHSIYALGTDTGSPYADMSASAVITVSVASSTYSINGTITVSGGVTPQAGVTVTLTGCGTGSMATNASGFYSFNGLTAGGNCTVTPALSPYTFTPPSQTFNNLSASRTANFTATPPGSITISGQVTGAGQNIVTINVNGSQTTSTTTNTSGAYTIPLPMGGSYTLEPALAGYSFSSPVTVSNLTTSQTGVNFTSVQQAGLDFYTLAPCRVVDTRPAAGFPSPFGMPTFSAGMTRSFTLPVSTKCSIPSNAVAYSLNVTAVPATSYLGFLTIWPTGQSQPGVSTLNSYLGTVVPNAAIVPAGTSGAISVYVTDPTDVLIDIDGYFAGPSSSGFEFFPVAPCRIADTRSGGGKTGLFGPGSLVANTARSYPIPANPSCVVPSTAAAYSLNFTAIPPGFLGFLSTWPTGQTEPVVSTLNSYLGTVVSNAAIVPAGTSGAISVEANAATDMLFDINGYFASATNGYHFYAVTPCRVADTRVGGGKSGPFGPPTMGANTSQSFPISSSVCGIPPTASAYSLNVTAIPSTNYLGYLSIWQTGQSLPVVSTLNSYFGTVVANAAIVPAGNGGAISIYVTDKCDVVLDIDGYFAP